MQHVDKGPWRHHPRQLQRAAGVSITRSRRHAAAMNSVDRAQQRRRSNWAPRRAPRLSPTANGYSPGRPLAATDTGTATPPVNADRPTEPVSPPADHVVDKSSTRCLYSAPEWTALPCGHGVGLRDGGMHRGCNRVVNTLQASRMTHTAEGSTCCRRGTHERAAIQFLLSVRRSGE